MDSRVNRLFALLLLLSPLSFIPYLYREALDALKLGTLAVYLSRGLKVDAGHEICSSLVIAWNALI
jgi:hypothetical protein